MRLLFFILVCFLNLTLIAQKQDIEIEEEERSASQIKLYAVNNTSEDLELTFNLDIVGFITQEKLPVLVALKPGIRKFLVTLTAPKGVQCQYESFISYKKVRKENSNVSPAGKIKKTTGVQINPSKINVFTKEGCERCAYLVKYLEDNKIPFLELNTTYHLPNNDLMFEKLKEVGFKGDTVQLPVVVSQTKVNFNIKNIQEFVKNLK